MTKPINWTCPHCDRRVVITDERLSVFSNEFDKDNKYGVQVFNVNVFICPNDECKEYTLFAWLVDRQYIITLGSSTYKDSKAKKHWQLIPEGKVKVFPSYIPSPILEDYREACLIRELSPKASATLARRCLQGIIRDYWGISKSKLKDEIDALKEKLDADTWDAIDGVRNIGNIGAHMEKDINIIIEVGPREAQLLIELIETLLREWYINRYERKKRMEAIKTIASEKLGKKKETS